MLLTRAGNAYTNDADGNTLTGGGRTNTWDSQNRMTSCVNGGNTSTFTYGADGIRHRSVVNGAATDFVLDASMFVRELQGGSSKATYFMGASGPAYRRDDLTSGIRWYLYDGLGSVLGEVAPDGSITATRKYDVYGAVRSSTGISTSKHKFVGALGHPYEDETGLTYMRARYYDPQTGRFVSEDSEAQGANWFNYCSNNPITYSDADGHRKHMGDFQFLVWETSNMLFTIAWGFAILACATAKVSAGMGFACVAACLFGAAMLGRDAYINPSSVTFDTIGKFISSELGGGVVAAITQMEELKDKCPRGIGYAAVAGSLTYALFCTGTMMSMNEDGWGKTFGQSP